MFDLAAPAAPEFVLNRFASLDDRHHVGVVVRRQQSETGAVVESAIEVDGLDAEVKTIEELEKLTKDVAGGVASVYYLLRTRAYSVA